MAPISYCFCGTSSSSDASGTETDDDSNTCDDDTGDRHAPTRTVQECSAAEPKSVSPKRRHVAFVTGGNTGIGKEIARKLASAGVRTILGCQDMESGFAAARELQAEGGDVACTYLDLLDPASVQASRDFILNEFSWLDILVNNAAVCFNDPTLYGKCAYTPFEKQAGISVSTNFFGTLTVIRAMLPLLRASPSARVVTISSSAGRLAILKSQERLLPSRHLRCK